MVVLVHAQFASLLEEIVDKRLFEWSLEGVSAYYSSQRNFSQSVSEHNRVEFKNGDNYVLVDRQGSGSRFSVWTYRNYASGSAVVGVPMNRDVVLFDYFISKCQLDGVGYDFFVLGLKKMGFCENRFGIDMSADLRSSNSVLPVFLKFRFSSVKGRLEYKLSSELDIDKLPAPDDTKEIDVSKVRQSLLGFKP